VRHRFLPADETQVMPILVLPPVPPPEGETEEQAREREGAPGASRGILRAAGTMAVATLVSRVTGLLRTIVLAAALGVGLVNDAYSTANTLPNIVYELLLGGVLTSVIVPLLVHAQERDRDGGRRLRAAAVHRGDRRAGRGHRGRGGGGPAAHRPLRHPGRPRAGPAGQLAGAGSCSWRSSSTASGRWPRRSSTRAASSAPRRGHGAQQRPSSSPPACCS
jgi:hypothetical protein